MKSRIAIVMLAGVLAAAMGLPGAQAQQKPTLVGAWTLVSTSNTDAKGAKIEPFGPHPLGAYMFDASGHFTQMLMSSDPSKPRSIAAYGTYSVTDGDKTLVLHIVGSAAPKFDGKDLKRQITLLTEDELRISQSTPQIGGGHVDAVWKRAK